MKEGCRFPSRFAGAACAFLLPLCTATTSTAQPLTIIAGPITNPANAHVYYLLAPTNWIGAWFNAQRAGGRLVTINDAAENAWVFDTFANHDGVPRNLWLGLKDSGQEGTWSWDSGDSSIYRNWAPGEPDNGGAGGNEDYAVMRGPALTSPGTWNDVAGDVTNAPVVEKTPPLPPVGDAPTITSQPQSWTVPVGVNVTFFVSATGTAPLSYQWRHEGTNLPAATNASLTLSNVQAADAGTYSVRVSNSFGVVLSSNATLTVFTRATNCVARPAGLVAWWRAEGNANDSARTNHGTTWPFPPSPSHYAAGKVGQTFDFGWGPVRVPGSADFLLTNSFTVEGWIYARESWSGVIFNLGGWPGAIGMGESWPGNVALAIRNASGQEVSLESPIQTNQWHHIAATLDGASGAMVLYVDGVARAQTTTVIRPYGELGAGDLPGILIGSNDGWARAPFYGLIDELSLYSRALSSNEVHVIYSADGAGKCLDGLVPLIVSNPTNQTVATGDNATFAVTATGAPPLNYQWQRYGTNLPGATTASLSLTNVQLADAGTYYVLVSNFVGVAVSSNATLSVFMPGTNCVARPAGLIAWWRADGNANDSIGTHHGRNYADWDTWNVMPAYAAGQVGLAFDFNGHHVVSVLGSPDFVLTNSFAVEGWIHARNGMDQAVVLSLGNFNHPGPVLLRTVPSSGKVTFEIRSIDYQSVLLQAPIETNQWHHVAATFEVTSGTLTLYVDGVTQSQTNTLIRPPLESLGSLPVIWIGNAIDGARWTYYPAYPFTGLIDELSIYSRALSSNEVHAIYSAGSGGKCVVSPTTLGVATLTCEPGATTTLRIGGMAGNTYFIQASTNLLDWQILGSSMADTNGVCEFQDLDSPRFPCRYYRVLTQ